MYEYAGIDFRKKDLTPKQKRFEKRGYLTKILPIKSYNLKRTECYILYIRKKKRKWR